MWRLRRGDTVCDKTARQPIYEVEGALTRWIHDNMLTAEVRSTVIAELKKELKAQLSGTGLDVEVAEKELARVKQELRNLAKAVATAGEQGVGVLDGFTLDCDPPADAAESSNRGGDPSPRKTPRKPC